MRHRYPFPPQEVPNREHLEQLLRYYPYLLLACAQVPKQVAPHTLISHLRRAFRGADLLDALAPRHLLLSVGVPHAHIAQRILQRFQRVLHQHFPHLPAPPVGGVLIQQIPEPPSTLQVWMERALKGARLAPSRVFLLDPHQESVELTTTLPTPRRPYEQVLETLQPQGGQIWITGGDPFLRCALLRRVAYEKHRQGFQVILIPGVPSPYLPLFPLLHPLEARPRGSYPWIQQLLESSLQAFCPLLEQYGGETPKRTFPTKMRQADGLLVAAQDLLRQMAQTLPTLWLVPEIHQADLETQNLVERLLSQPVPGLSIAITGHLLFPPPEELPSLSLDLQESWQTQDILGLPHLLKHPRRLKSSATSLTLWLLEHWLVHRPDEPPPAHFPALVAEILEALPPLVQRMLLAMAVLKHPITSSLLAQWLDLPALQVEEALETLKGWGLLLEEIGTYFLPCPDLATPLLKHFDSEQQQEVRRSLLAKITLQDPLPAHFQLWAAEQAEEAAQAETATHLWSSLGERFLAAHAWRSGLRALSRALEIMETYGLEPKHPLVSLPLEKVLFYRYILREQDPTRQEIHTLVQRLETLGYYDEWIQIQDWIVFQDLQSGRFSEAEQKAHRIFRVVEERAPHLEGLALKILGSCAWYQDRFAEARTLWLKALQRGQGFSSLQRARILGNIGMIYEEEEQFETALKFYQAAMEVFYQEDFVGGLATGSGMMARVEQKLGHLGKALQLFEKALFYARSAREFNDEALWQLELALLYRELGTYEQAQYYAERSLAHFRDTQNLYHLLLTQGILGEIHLLSGDLEKAEALLSNSLEKAKKTQDTGLTTQILANWINTLLAMNQLERVEHLIAEHKPPSSLHLNLWLLAYKVTPATFSEFERKWRQLRKERNAFAQLIYYRIYLEALHRAQQPDFSSVLQQAYRHVLQLAQSVDIPEIRKNFLHRNPNAARIRQWAFEISLH